MLLDWVITAAADDQSLAAFVAAGDNHVIGAQPVITRSQVREIAFAERRAIAERFGETCTIIEAFGDVHFHVRNTRRMPAKQILDFLKGHGAGLEKRLVRVDFLHIKYSVTL